MARKDYIITVATIDVETNEDVHECEINFSTKAGKEQLHNLIFKALNNNQAVDIALDRTQPIAVDMLRQIG